MLKNTLFPKISDYKDDVNEKTEYRSNSPCGCG